MNYYFDPRFIKGNETLFNSYLIIIALIILITVFLVIKNVRKKKNVSK